MTQVSRFWDGTAVGDAVEAPYDAGTEFSKVMNSISGAAGLANLSGVFTGELNELAVSGAVTPVSIATGRSMVWGVWFENDVAVTIAIPSPSGATRIDRIVVRKDWLAQTARITRIAGIEGGASPALVQIAGTTWDEPLAEVSITTGGAITITDQRAFLNSAAAGTGIGIANSVYTSNGVSNSWSATPTLTSVTTTGIISASGLITANAGVAIAGTLAMASASVINWNAGDITLTHSANTLTLAGGDLVGSGANNVTGFSTVSAATLTGLLSTATQSNITAVGTLTSLTTSGDITMTASLSRIIPGATSFAIRNAANSANNFIMDNAGNVTILGSVTAASFSGGFTLAGNLDMTNNLILNIGAAGTDFTAGGGLTLALGLIVSSGGVTVTGNSTVTGTLGGITTLTAASAIISTGGIRLTGGILDSTGATLISTTAIASAVNGINITNAITATPPIISPEGTDSNIDLRISAKGTGALHVNAGLYETIQTYSPSAAGTATLDLSKGDIHHITMPAGNITIALSNAKAGQIFMVRILQDGVGSRTVTWFTTIRWAAGGAAPTLTTTASKVDTFLFEAVTSSTFDGYVGAQNI